MRNFIKKEIEKVVGKADFDVFRSENFGDYSSNVAMVLNKDPENLKNKISNLKSDFISKIEVAGPGFLNFYLKDEVFIKNISDILKTKEKYGSNNLLKGQKIIVEYTDPNPFKEFHIGHLMSNAIGESITRILEISGAKIKRISYGGDVGLHVAKAIWGKLQKPEMAWGEAYVYGTSNYENNKEEIDELNKTIFEKKDKEINNLYEQGKELSITHFQEMFKRLGTRFDKNIWESEVTRDAIDVVKIGLDKKILEYSDGAVVFKGEQYGLHTRVFVNSKGIPTYEAKDLGLGIKKYEMFSFDKSIIVTGNEQNDYFKVLFKTIDLIKPEIAHKTSHIGHGMLRFASGKMSSRKGNVITAAFLIDNIKTLVFEKIAGRGFDNSEKEKIAEHVSLAAIKYSILKQSPGNDIIFDLKKSISFEGNSGPYLQYTYVRAMSVLKIAEEKKIKASIDVKNIEITDVEKILYRFPEIVEEAQEKCAPNYICSYLIELAHCFNSYYSKFKIVSGDAESPYRISLTKAVAITIKNGLNLLAISAPEKM
jgi:arginyl-tRNA synthetase